MRLCGTNVMIKMRLRGRGHRHLRVRGAKPFPVRKMAVFPGLNLTLAQRLSLSGTIFRETVGQNFRRISDRNRKRRITAFAFWRLCSLIENTGYTVCSIIIGICHAVTPVLFLFFDYQCLLHRIPQYGIAKSLLAGAVCCAVYFCGFVLESYCVGRSSGNVEDRTSDSRAGGSFSRIYLWIPTIERMRGFQAFTGGSHG